MSNLFQEIGDYGIDFVDVGCSGSLDVKWRSLFDVLNYVGFEPNQEECRRLSALPSPFRQTRFLSYAISGQDGVETMHLTKSPQCSSLLQPRHNWLDRFTFGPIFQELGTAPVKCVKLDSLTASENLQADIIKLDTQGLELPILSTASSLLSNVFCVETETGFVENYIGETVTSQVDEFMRRQGFLLFDITVHRMGRDNPLAAQSRQQPLWSEILWFRDYLGAETWGNPVPLPNRTQALKALYICKSLGFPDYGFELAEYFHKNNILTAEELQYLSKPASWERKDKSSFSLVGQLFRLLPSQMRQKLFKSLGYAVNQPHLLRSLLVKS